MNGKLKKNFIYVLLAQLISLLVSCSTNLILPKFISATGFSYWQLFMFYTLYIPCLALGLNDGVYLRYGGRDKEDLDYDAVKSQYIFGIMYQVVLAIIAGGILIYFSESNGRRWVIYSVLVYYVVYTCHNFLSYIFQATGESNVWSRSVILHRVIFLSAQTIFLLLGIYNVFYFMIAFNVALLMALIYLYIFMRKYLKRANFNWCLGITEAIISIKVGISLMIANVCATLILGVGRFIIDNKWGLLAFGKVSFSLTLINFALTFISQIGIVLFPALRRIDVTELKQYYRKIAVGLFYILPIMYIVYLPLKYILLLWLPNYSQSIDYLSILLPICFFDSKMNLMGNTFLKVLSKQVVLLKINILTIILGGSWSFLAAYYFNNIKLVIIGMVISIIFRSLIADIILEKELSVNLWNLEVLDIVLAVVFILTTTYLLWWQACLIIMTIYIMRSMYYRFNE